MNRFERPYEWISTLPAKFDALTPGHDHRDCERADRPPDALTWVVVGDLAQTEDAIRALNLGPVEVWDAEGRKLR